MEVEERILCFMDIFKSGERRIYGPSCVDIIMEVVERFLIWIYAVILCGVVFIWIWIWNCGLDADGYMDIWKRNDGYVMGNMLWISICSW